MGKKQIAHMPHMSLGLMLRLNVHTLDNLGSFMSRYCRQQMLWYLLLYIAKHTLRAHCHGFYEPFLGETRPSALGTFHLIHGPCKPVYLFTTRRRTQKIFSLQRKEENIWRKEWEGREVFLNTSLVLFLWSRKIPLFKYFLHFSAEKIFFGVLRLVVNRYTGLQGP